MEIERWGDISLLVTCKHFSLILIAGSKSIKNDNDDSKNDDNDTDCRTNNNNDNNNDNENCDAISTIMMIVNLNDGKRKTTIDNNYDNKNGNNNGNYNSN